MSHIRCTQKMYILHYIKERNSIKRLSEYDVININDVLMKLADYETSYLVMECHCSKRNHKKDREMQLLQHVLCQGSYRTRYDGLKR